MGWRRDRPKVMGIVEDGDLLRAVCHKEKTVGLVEPRLFVC